MEKTLEQLRAEAMLNVRNHDEFEGQDDIKLLQYAIKDVEEVNSIELKPHLIIWNLNKWMPIREYIEEALELIGYEYIGNMDTNEYKFEFENEYHDILFRFKESNCDYTKTLKLDME
jgi:hypothetical protein